MEKVLVKTAFFFLFASLFVQGHSFAQASSTEVWSKSKAATWFKSREWSHGLTFTPHSSVNQQEFARQYHLNQAVWDKAFAFLKETDLENLAPGKYPLDGENAYVSVTEAPGKDLENVQWESHRKYIDIQYVVKGEEKIGVSSLEKAAVTQAYNETKDVVNYTTEAGTFYVAQPGTFFIFFPQDAHRPGIKTKGEENIKKVVIKVKVAG